MKKRLQLKSAAWFWNLEFVLLTTVVINNFPYSHPTRKNIERRMLVFVWKKEREKETISSEPIGTWWLFCQLCECLIIDGNKMWFAPFPFFGVLCSSNEFIFFCVCEKTRLCSWLFCEELWKLWENSQWFFFALSARGIKFSKSKPWNIYFLYQLA